MISFIKVKSGFAAELPALKGRGIKLPEGPGLILIAGPNGSGKTTLLRIMAAYAGCRTGQWSRGGWSTFIEPSVSGPKGYLHKVARTCPGESAAEVHWDGSASFLYEAGLSDAPMSALEQPNPLYQTFSQVMSGEGDASSIGAHLALRNASSGQVRIQQLTQLLGLSGEVPDIEKALTKRKASVNSRWQSAIDGFLDYVKTSREKHATKTGEVITLFLDEPDRSLSLQNQMFLFRSVLPELATRFQVIVTTHSPVALTAGVAGKSDRAARPRPFVIETEPGYADSIAATLLKLSGMLTGQSVSGETAGAAPAGTLPYDVARWPRGTAKAKEGESRNGKKKKKGKKS